jgi:hypothetical protein
MTALCNPADMVIQRDNDWNKKMYGTGDDGQPEAVLEGLVCARPAHFLCVPWANSHSYNSCDFCKSCA